MKACLIVGDIVKSQKLEDLAGVVGRLKKALNQINRKYKDELVGKFVIFGGDSFEGVLRTPRSAYDIYRHIFMALRPVRVRCVVGIGEIDSLAGGNVLEMTGPVFTRATEALADIGTARRRPKVYFQVMSGHPDRDAPINTIAMLLEVIRNRWDDHTYEIAEVFEDKRGNISEIARTVKLTRRAVYGHIRGRGIAEVGQAEEEIRDELRRFD